MVMPMKDSGVIVDRPHKPTPTRSKINSYGGSSAYYQLPEYATELKHLISAREMSFARGNVFKACYRLGEKEGTDIEYDLRKMLFFVQDMIDMHDRGEKI